MGSPASELRDGMRIDWDAPILMDDGLTLRADVFCPSEPGRYPVILSYGPYAKGLAFQEGYPSAWQRMSAYPGLDAEMLPLALIVVILGGVGSLLGAFVGSFITAAIYTFGSALLPDLAYVILFLPMIFVIAFRPRGLFGRHGA